MPKIPQENNCSKKDLNVLQDNNKMSKKKKKKIFNKTKMDFLKRGFGSGDVFGDNNVNVLDWLQSAGVGAFPVKMASSTGAKSKIPTNQTGANGKPLPGWKDEGQTQNNKGKMGYWTRPADFKTLSDLEIQARNSDLAWNQPTSKGAHDAKKFAWLDLDSSMVDKTLTYILKKYPHYPSNSNPLLGGGKTGRFHIPILCEGFPVDFPDNFLGVGPKNKSKCYYNDEFCFESEGGTLSAKKKIELFSGNNLWLYFNRDAEMINPGNPILTLNYTKFIPFIHKKNEKVVSDKNEGETKSEINHTIKDKEISAKNLEKFTNYSKLILTKIWDRTEGKLHLGGNWKLIMNAAKWEGMSWIEWDKLCKCFPNNYNYEKNKMMWDKIVQAECYRTDLNTIRTMAQGWKNDEGEPQGKWKEFQELDSHFTQAEKFCRFKFNKIVLAAKAALANDEGGGDKEVDTLTEEINTLEFEKAGSTDRVRNKEIRGLIRALKEDIREVKAEGKDNSKGEKIINECYKKCKNYFEKFHFKLKYPKPGFAISSKTDIHFWKNEDLKNLYENLTIPQLTDKGKVVMKLWTDIWKKDLYIRTLDECDFLPPPLERDYDTFNLFRGLKAARIPDSVEAVSEQEMLDIFGSHIKILVGGDNPKYINPKTALDPYNYMLMTLAHQVQFPGEIAEVAPVIVGEQGTGKSLFISKFAETIMGREYLLKTSNINDIVGQFSRIDRKLCVMLEEASGKATFGESNKVKEKITDARVSWEQKYKDGLMINNCATYWFLSNDRTPVKIELGDRRFVVFVCSSKWKKASIKDRTDYFNQLAAAFSDPRYVKAFYNYLLNLDLTLPKHLQEEPNGKTQFKPKNNRPFTERYCDIQSVNVPKPYYFFAHYTEMSGINHINAGESDGSEEEQETYLQECERIDWDKTHLLNQKGEVIECNKHITESKADIYEQYQSYLDGMGMTSQKDYTDATKFWRNIKEWIEDPESKWGEAISLVENENGVRCAVVRPIEMRDCLREHIHLLVI